MACRDQTLIVAKLKVIAALSASPALVPVLELTEVVRPAMLHRRTLNVPDSTETTVRTGLPVPPYEAIVTITIELATTLLFATWNTLQEPAVVLALCVVILPE